MTNSNNREIITKYPLIIFVIIAVAGTFLFVNTSGPKIHLVGKVTDMNNRELEDVRLDLDFSRHKNFGLETEDLRETRKINGSFTIEKRHYTSVSISFLKPGYRTENITFYTSKEANNPLSAIQENCHIKLREIGTLAALVKGDAHLEYDEERQLLRVFDLSAIADGYLKKRN